MLRKAKHFASSLSKDWVVAKTFVTRVVSSHSKIFNLRRFHCMICAPLKLDVARGNVKANCVFFQGCGYDGQHYHVLTCLNAIKH